MTLSDEYDILIIEREEKSMEEYLFAVWTDLKDNAKVALTESELDDLRSFFSENRVVIEYDSESDSIQYTIENRLLEDLEVLE